MRHRQRSARDRRGRGLRGTLVPPSVPLARSRAEQFDDLVLEAVDQLDPEWGDQLDQVEFAVEDVPPDQPPGADSDGIDDNGVALARMTPAVPGRRGQPAQPARVVVYRRPLEARAVDRADLADLVLAVVVQEVAALLGVDPAAIDPDQDDA